MQKHDDLSKVFSNFADINGKLRQLLFEEKNLSSVEINVINDLYSKRADIIESLNFFVKSEEGKKFINSDFDFWDSKFKSIIKEDEIILQQFKKRVDELGSKIKDISINKSLLVYSKNK